MFAIYAFCIMTGIVLDYEREEIKMKNDIREEVRRVVTNLQWQIDEIRNNANRAVTDYANGRNHDAQKEMRMVIDALDSMSKRQLQSVLYDL